MKITRTRTHQHKPEIAEIRPKSRMRAALAGLAARLAAPFVKAKLRAQAVEERIDQALDAKTETLKGAAKKLDVGFEAAVERTGGKLRNVAKEARDGVRRFDERLDKKTFLLIAGGLLLLNLGILAVLVFVPRPVVKDPSAKPLSRRVERPDWREWKIKLAAQKLAEAEEEAIRTGVNADPELRAFLESRGYVFVEWRETPIKNGTEVIRRAVPAALDYAAIRKTLREYAGMLPAESEQ